MEQVREGNSLPVQESLCTEYAQKRGYQIDHIFHEEGESAKTADRTKLKEMIAYIDAHSKQIEALIVYRIDRLSRVTEDYLVLKACFAKRGVRVYSVSEEINDSPSGRFVETLLAATAQLDNEVRAERSRNGMVARVQQGLWVWAEPYGYKRDKKGGNIVPDPEIAPIVEMIFEEWVKGTYTFGGLAKLLAERGVKTRKLHTPTMQFVSNILRNPVYQGDIESFGAVQPGSFSPLVSRTLFAQAQDVILHSKHGRKYRSSRLEHFPLRNFVTCANCGVPLTGSFSTGKLGTKYPYYHHGAKKCMNAKSISKKDFEARFVELLASIAPSEEYADLFKVIVLDVWKNKYALFDKTQERTRNAIKRLEGERQEIFAAQRRGLYSDEEFIKQKTEINIQISEFERLIQENRLIECDMDTVLTKVFKFVRNISEEWVTAKLDTKLRLQKLVFERSPQFDGVAFGTPETSLIFETKKAFHEGRSSLVTPRGVEPRLPG